MLQSFGDKALGVTLGNRLPLQRPRLEVWKLAVEHGRLKRIESAVDANHLVVVPRLHAVSAKQPKPGS